MATGTARRSCLSWCRWTTGGFRSSTRGRSRTVSWAWRAVRWRRAHAWRCCWRRCPSARAADSRSGDLFAVLALAGRGILVDAGHLAGGRVLEHFAGGLEVAAALTAVARVPDEVADDGDDDDDRQRHELKQDARHQVLFWMMAAVP